MLLDAGLCMLGLWFSHALRAQIDVGFLPDPSDIEGFERFTWVMILIPLLTPFIFYTQGYYTQDLLPHSRVRHYAALGRGCLLLFMIIILAMFLMKWTLARSVLLLFLFLILRLIHLAERQPYRFGRVYGYSVLSIFLFHVFINVGMVLGLTPVIGIPLPFFSYGGSSLWGFTILLFIFLRIDAGRNLARS